MRLFLVLMASLLLSACGDDGDTSKTEQAGMAEKAESMAESAKSEMQEGMKVVDHTMDEMEFELKRSINGLERMIEQYKEEGYDYSDLEKQKKELEKELDNL